MTEQLATRTMRARRESVCPRCLLLIRPGDQIAKAGVWQHIEHITDRMRYLDGADGQLRWRSQSSTERTSQ